MNAILAQIDISLNFNENNENHKVYPNACGLGAEMLRNIWRQIMASSFLQYLIDAKRFILENSNSASKTIIEYGTY